MKAKVIFLVAAVALDGGGSTRADERAPVEKHRIVPGERIGCLVLGGRSDKQDDAIKHDLGEPNHTDHAMGGHFSEIWVLGTPPHRGKDFPATDEIGAVEQTEHQPGAVTQISRVWTTSADYVTAEGIGVGSTVEQIRLRYPEVQLDAQQYTDDPSAAKLRIWPLYGEMDFYVSKPRGVAFAIQKKEGACVEVVVESKGEANWGYDSPLAATYPKMTPQTHED